MPIPPFSANGVLPDGRHVCDLDEFEEFFVFDAQFADSTVREKLFSDFLAALNLLEEFDPRLVERMWFGGGFTSSKLDPSDIDVTFLVNFDTYNGLSKSAQKRILKLCKHGFESQGLEVDGFLLPRERIANPWKADGLKPEAIEYTSLRGAWDDWWSRARVHGAPEEEPLVEDSDPVRGYVEVIRRG